ncbi:MAG: ORF6N domain-containing protein [Bacteroidota bacterium]
MFWEPLDVSSYRFFPIKRFPDELMFQLTQDEWASLRSQIVTLKNSENSLQGNQELIHQKNEPMTPSGYRVPGNKNE